MAAREEQLRDWVEQQLQLEREATDARADESEAAVRAGVERALTGVARRLERLQMSAHHPAQAAAAAAVAAAGPHGVVTGGGGEPSVASDREAAGSDSTRRIEALEKRLAKLERSAVVAAEKAEAKEEAMEQETRAAAAALRGHAALQVRRITVTPSARSTRHTSRLAAALLCTRCMRAVRCVLVRQ
eukprot:SAG25_NODE_3028_length_1261_cov_0.933735_1_plen_187_part_00